MLKHSIDGSTELTIGMLDSKNVCTKRAKYKVSKIVLHKILPIRKFEKNTLFNEFSENYVMIKGLSCKPNQKN